MVTACRIRDTIGGGGWTPENDHILPHVTVNELHAYPHPHCLPPLAPLDWEILRPRHPWKVYLVGLVFPR